jgi:hypothetical protein
MRRPKKSRSTASGVGRGPWVFSRRQLAVQPVDGVGAPQRLALRGGEPEVGKLQVARLEEALLRGYA